MAIGDLVSIIVPVYNTEKYLSKCLDSLLAQEYKNTEIIVIDDGSTDSCPEIIDQYLIFSNIRSYRQSNQGLASARNSGLSKAKGKWVCFVDSDDYIDSTMIKNMLTCAVQYNVDIVDSKFTFESSRSAFEYDTVISCSIDNQKLDSFFEKFYYLYHSSVCTKLIKKDIINDIVFVDKQVTPEEDSLFSLKLLSRARSIAFCNYGFYHYFMRPGSITHTFQEDDRFVDRMVYKVDLVKKFYIQNGCNINLNDFYGLLFFNALSSGINNLSDISFRHFYNVIKRIKNTHQDDDYFRYTLNRSKQYDGESKFLYKYSKVCCFFLQHKMDMIGVYLLNARAKRLRKQKMI